MLLSKERIIYLLNVWFDGKAREAEKNELFEWVNENDDQELILQHIRHLTEQYNFKDQPLTVNCDHLYEQIINKTTTSKQYSLVNRTPWLRWSAAAAIIVLLGAGFYVYKSFSPSKKIITAETAQKPVIYDVPAPVKNKAILTLADGRKVELDSISNGMLAQQGSVQVVKQADGEISYFGTGSENLYNTLNVPRGSKVVTIKLSDGTLVWLNSESSLKYPASFTGSERKVEITGEAYFEVMHNASMPFIVKKGAMEIKVLGTHFNINTYEDERINKVTLLAGSVKVSLNDQQDLLKPGQQAHITDEIKLVNGVNIEEVMAWKNGIFQFGEKADLHLIMRKIARWYDVEVNYEGGSINQRFGGEIPMNSNLSDVLEILRTSGVKFTIEGKKVLVKP